jgi:hypothetical protein
VKDNVPPGDKAAETVPKGKDNTVFDSMLSLGQDEKSGNQSTRTGDEGMQADERKTATTSLPSLEIDGPGGPPGEEVESPKSGISDSIIVDPADTDLFEKPLDYSEKSLVRAGN